MNKSVEVVFCSYGRMDDVFNACRVLLKSRGWSLLYL